MTSPWLDIRLDDYEAHMALPSVGQAQLLSDLLAAALERHRPRSLAVLGCAGGNGFERIPASVERVVGVDLNPAFLERARERYAARMPGLELVAGDVATTAFSFAPVDLVFAGLLFEYVDVAAALRSVRRVLRPDGTLLVVLQLPAETAHVTPSPYVSLAALSPVLSLVDPERFAALAADSGFRAVAATTAVASGGKRFHVGTFAAAPPAGPRHGDEPE